jgi:RNA-directed DNA polymerase
MTDKPRRQTFWEFSQEMADMLRAARRGRDGEEVVEADLFEEGSRPEAALDRQKALASESLMEVICQSQNLSSACRRVVSNDGSPGVDDMSAGELKGWLAEHEAELVEQLLGGRYQPTDVRGIEIPKASGKGMRQLGIPTVIDRLVQQAILQVLSPLIDPTFSQSSYGFRPGRSAHDALRQAKEYVAAGRAWVVDLDLEKFFDRVNHDVLMHRLGLRVRDKRVLQLLGRFLRAGMMQNGVRVRREEGTPQGGPLSPLLANVLLDDLDKELEKRGHCFCRYADDCNIYVGSKASGERVMASVTRFLEETLRLRVNRQKSAVAPTWERKFLGYRLLAGGGLGLAPESLKRAKERVRQLTQRNRGVAVQQVIKELNKFLIGWVGYFRLARCRTHLERLDEWVRRKVRCYRLKQRKRRKAVADFLMELGVPAWRAWTTALSGKGWWRLSGSPSVHEGMSIAWFERLGLVSITQRYAKLHH